MFTCSPLPPCRLEQESYHLARPVPALDDSWDEYFIKDLYKSRKIYITFEEKKNMRGPGWHYEAGSFVVSERFS
jgi:hypothetical protein